MHYSDAYVPEELFAEAHFKVLLHVDTICTELNGGFECGLDPFMRCNKASFNVMSKWAPRPKRPAHYPKWKQNKLPRVATVIKDGTEVIDGDDWCCLHDMAEVGYFSMILDGEMVKAEAIRVIARAVIYLSPRGQQVISGLKKAIVENGHYRDFTAIIAQSRPTHI